MSCGFVKSLRASGSLPERAFGRHGGDGVLSGQIKNDRCTIGPIFVVYVVMDKTIYDIEKIYDAYAELVEYYSHTVHFSMFGFPEFEATKQNFLWEAIQNVFYYMNGNCSLFTPSLIKSEPYVQSHDTLHRDMTLTNMFVDLFKGEGFTVLMSENIFPLFQLVVDSTLKAKIDFSEFGYDSDFRHSKKKGKFQNLKYSTDKKPYRKKPPSFFTYGELAYISGKDYDDVKSYFNPRRKVYGRAGVVEGKADNAGKSKITGHSLDIPEEFEVLMMGKSTVGNGVLIPHLPALTFLSTATKYTPSIFESKSFPKYSRSQYISRAIDLWLHDHPDPEKTQRQLHQKIRKELCHPPSSYLDEMRSNNLSLSIGLVAGIGRIMLNIDKIKGKGVFFLIIKYQE